MKISCVDYHINASLQFAAALITKCIGWIYYKMLHPHYTMRTLFQNACRNRYNHAIFDCAVCHVEEENDSALWIGTGAQICPNQIPEM